MNKQAEILHGSHVILHFTYEWP